MKQILYCYIRFDTNSENSREVCPEGLCHYMNMGYENCPYGNNSNAEKKYLEKHPEKEKK